MLYALSHQGIGVLADIHHMTKEVLAKGGPGLLILIQALELARPLILAPSRTPRMPNQRLPSFSFHTPSASI
jgi:hypothetical protein